MRFATELRERRAASTARPRPSRPAGTGWEDPLARAGAGLIAWLTRPHVRAVLVGLALLVLSVTVLAHSVWTLPLLIVGVAMVVVAWIGRRLEGRFAIEWGQDGAGFEMRARVKAPEPVATTPAHAGPGAALAPAIEGEAHTVEIDVVELRALIDAAERSRRAA